mgnify:CR=1 FL=1
MLAAGLAFGFAGCGDDRHENTFPQTDSPAGSDDNAGDEEDDAAPDPEAGNILVVYYSYTNNTHAVVSELSTRIDADIVRIEPAEKGLDYAAGNYALGSALISAIRANPDDAASYPEIDPVDVNIEDYDTVIVATPLWWSNMAAPMQTFLFENGGRMSGRNIGLIVSSASSGIGGVEADARRLVPEGNFMSRSLWIRSSQTASCHTMIAEWLEDVGLTE